MERVFVIFGGNASILTDFIDKIRETTFRIYGTNKPKAKKNCWDSESVDDFKIKFDAFNKREEIKDIVFIGAAFKNQSKMFNQESLDDCLNQIDTNIIQYVSLAKYLLPIMMNIRSGKFIYISSFRANNTARGTSIYSASKAFGEKFFEVIGKENGVLGITSSSIRLGYFDGGMLSDFNDTRLRGIKRAIGNRYLGNSYELSSAIKFLIENRYTNGGIIELTGGINFEH